MRTGLLVLSPAHNMATPPVCIEGWRQYGSVKRLAAYAAASGG